MVRRIDNCRVKTCTNIDRAAQKGHVFAVSDRFDTGVLVKGMRKIICILCPFILGDAISEEVIAVIAIVGPCLDVLQDGDRAVYSVWIIILELLANAIGQLLICTECFNRKVR